MNILLWYILPCILILSGLLTIVVQDPIYSLLYLILTFVIASLILILINLDSIGFIFLIIYVGAILVLFLFVIMMLIESNNINHRFSSSLIRYLPFLILFCFLFFSIIKFLVQNFI